MGYRGFRANFTLTVCCDVNSRRKWELQYHTRIANVMYFRSCTVPYGTNVTYIRSCTIPRYGTGTGTSTIPYYVTEGHLCTGTGTVPYYVTEGHPYIATSTVT